MSRYTNFVDCSMICRWNGLYSNGEIEVSHVQGELEGSSGGDCCCTGRYWCFLQQFTRGVCLAALMILQVASDSCVLSQE